MTLSINFVKEIALMYSKRVFEAHYGISIMFGDSEKFYSWFPGPGEIRLNVIVNESAVDFTLDTNSLKGVDFNYMTEFLKGIREASQLTIQMNLHLEMAKILKVMT